MRQTIDDVDVIDLLDVGDGDGGVRVGGAELGLVEGGNQPGAVERREMFGQHPVQSVRFWILGQNSLKSHHYQVIREFLLCLLQSS